MDDPYDLARFVTAQERVFDAAVRELKAGQKRSHWMWFVFPQLRGLGSSPMAERYGISSLEEARAYLAHPLLGARLRQCTQLLNEIVGRDAETVFGYPDYLKFRSCMTLFEQAAGVEAEVFSSALARYFAGEGDPLTRRMLA